jgi:hypothetical protein
MKGTNEDSGHLADVLAGVLRRAVGEGHQYERALPHLLVCCDPQTGQATYSGPFRSRQAAELVTEHERRSCGPDSGLIFYTSPLYPPLDLAAFAQHRADRRHDARPHRPAGRTA